MARALPIVGVCAMLLLASLYTAYLVEERARRPSGPEKAHVEVPEFRNITLNTTIPEGPATFDTYRIQPVPFSRAWGEGVMRSLYPGWMNGTEDYCGTSAGFSLTHNRKSQNGTNESNIDMMGVVNNGFFFYHDNVSLSRWFDLHTDLLLRRLNGTGNGSTEGLPLVSREQALTIADRYISDHGGLPDGGFLLCETRLQLVDKRDELFTEGMDRNISNYAFLYGRRLDGRYIASNGALVALTPLGEVFLYAYLWSNATVVNRTVGIVPARRALEHLDSLEGTAGLGIFGIELGYGFWIYDLIWDELKPVWIFYLNRGRTSYIFIDAVDLGYYQVIQSDIFPFFV